jgi:hypothetical protein
MKDPKKGREVAGAAKPARVIVNATPEEIASLHLRTLESLGVRVIRKPDAAGDGGQGIRSDGDG